MADTAAPAPSGTPPAIDSSIANTRDNQNIPRAPVPPQSNWNVPGAQLRSEYVSGAGVPFVSRYIKSLPQYIDDISRDFGSNIYEKMLLDPQVNSCIRLLVIAIIEDGIELDPAIDVSDASQFTQSVGDEDITANIQTGRTQILKDEGIDTEADAQLAEEICDWCVHMIEKMDRPFMDLLYEMLFCLATGNKIAEQVWALEDDEDGQQRLYLKKLKTKQRETTAFVVDQFMEPIGLLALIPGQGYPVMTGMIVGDPSQLPNMLPLEKFFILQWGIQNSDPRGSALDPETPIPTPNGWRKLDDLQVGDKVFDEEGRIRYIVARKDWDDRPCYELKFNDGNTIIADENHQWKTQLLHERSLRQSGKIRTTKEIVATLKNSTNLANHGIAWSKAVDYPEQILPVDPYYLGLWLGDGDSKTAGIACHVQDAEEEAELLRRIGYSVKIYQNGPKGCKGRQLRVGGDKKWDSSGPSHQLRILGVINNKHIPECYLRGSIEQRLALLSGLMDSDGTVNKDGRCEFTNTNKNIADGVLELVRSLGCQATIRLNKISPKSWQCAPAWDIRFTPEFCPFRLERKRAKTINERARKYHYIVDAKKVESRRTVCIEVDSPSHLFLAGRSFVPTHNSLLRCVYNSWWLKTQCWGEYLRYLATFASGFILGKTQQNAQALPEMDSLGNPIPGSPILSPEQRMANELERVRNGGVVVTPFGSETQIVQAQGAGNFVYNSAINLFDLQIAKGILCQTLASELHAHQARAAASAHQDILDEVVVQARTVAVSAIQKQIIYRAVLYNWGKEVADRLCPKVRAQQAEKHNWATDANSIAALVTSQFLDKSQYTELDERLGLPQRDPNWQQNAAAAGGGAPGGQPPQDQGAGIPGPVPDNSLNANSQGLPTGQQASVAGAMAGMSANDALAMASLADSTQTVYFDGVAKTRADVMAELIRGGATVDFAVRYASAA